jgi:photosystem II stability/assembly factor-like uncharacterized protein
MSGLLGSCTLLRNTSVEQYSNIKVQFVNSSIGWIVGPRLLRTTDGGRTWISISEGGTGTFKVEDISIGRQKIQFMSPGLGWSLEGEGIARTADGGFTWSNTKITVGKDYSLESLFFMSADEGWAVGKYVYHTGDGGRSWQKLSETPKGDPQRQIDMHVAEENANYNPALWFTDANHGLMARLDGEVHETNDGGRTWKMVWKVDRRIEDVFFVHKQSGWMVDSEGIISRTIDGGHSWSIVRTPTTNSLHSVFFINEQIGWAVGDDAAILYSKDGGSTWKQATVIGLSKPFPPLASVSFTDNLHGWAVGGLSESVKQGSGAPLPNVVLTTNDGGESWRLARL